MTHVNGMNRMTDMTRTTGGSGSSEAFAAAPRRWPANAHALLAALAVGVLTLALGVVPTTAAHAAPSAPVVPGVPAAPAAPAAPSGPAAPSAPAEADAEPEFDESTIFEREQDGYFCFRIPAVVETQEGTLLAFAEGRKDDGCGDSGNIDTVLRRSHDGGKTWGPVELVDDAGADTIGGPLPIVDEETGRIVLITTHNPATNHNLRTPYVQYSDDDGETWSEKESIKDDIMDPSWQKWFATGPGHGIQLNHGPHAGRMLIGLNHEGYISGSESHDTGAALAYSDDGGETWQLGADEGFVPEEMKPQELSLAELPDGKILVSAREQHGSAEGNRAVTTSSDGGESYDSSFETDPELATPVSQGAIETYVDEQGRDRVLYAGESHPRARKVLSIRSSFDQGRTWQSWEEGKVVNWGHAAYSDILPLADDDLALVYETGEENAYQEIRFARFDSAYLDSPNDEAPGVIQHPDGPTTPDSSPQENTAYVRGNPDLVEGVHGKALEMDMEPAENGDNDRVDVPYGEAVDLDDSDFTVSTWFRYGEEDHDQVFVWGYTMGSDLPGLWIRGEPGADRIRAMIGTETGDLSLTTEGAYNDKEWHHLAMTRTDDVVQLWVDGEKVAEGETPAGSLTRGGELVGIDGIFLGQRLDGNRKLAGALDDVRLYDSALEDEEVGALAEGETELEADTGLRLHLPLDEIDEE